MGIHSADASEHVTMSNMKFLYEQLQKADRVLNFQPARIAASDRRKIQPGSASPPTRFPEFSPPEM